MGCDEGAPCAPSLLVASLRRRRFVRRRLSFCCDVVTTVVFANQHRFDDCSALAWAQQMDDGAINRLRCSVAIRTGDRVSGERNNGIGRITKGQDRCHLALVPRCGCWRRARGAAPGRSGAAVRGVGLAADSLVPELALVGARGDGPLNVLARLRVFACRRRSVRVVGIAAEAAWLALTPGMTSRSNVRWWHRPGKVVSQMRAVFAVLLL